jgi:threonine/homoserine/homoserine lactone efflux protein
VLSLSQILTFLAAAMLLTLTPGPDNLMVLGISLSRGGRQGIIFGVGCALGCVSHVFMAIIGISAFIIASPKAFFMLKFVGGAYLIYLGSQLFLGERSKKIDIPKLPDDSSNKVIFIKGLVASSINPKVAIFFISFLPQFVVPHQGNITFQFSVLSLIFILQAVFVFCFIGYFSGAIGNLLRKNVNIVSWLDWIGGALLVFLGIRMWFGS